MRKSLIVGLMLALVLFFAPAVTAEEPADGGGFSLLEWVLDWLGVSDDEDGDPPGDEIGPVYDPGG